MTISTLDNRDSYVGDGATLIYPYTFRVLDQTHFEIYVAGAIQTLTTHYTVSGIGFATGGNITFVTAPASGAKVEIFRVVVGEPEVAP